MERTHINEPFHYKQLSEHCIEWNGMSNLVFQARNNIFGHSVQKRTPNVKHSLKNMTTHFSIENK